MTSDLETSQPGSPSDHGSIGPVTITPPPVLKVRSWSFLAVVLTMVGLMVALQLIDQVLQPPGIVGLELAGTRDQASSILSEWHGEGVARQALWSVVLDFPFIASYSLVLASLAFAAGRWGWSRLPHFAWLGLAIAWGQYLAGFADLGENLALLAMLGGGPHSPFPEIARSLAILKFDLVAVGAAFIVLSPLARFAGPR